MDFDLFKVLNGYASRHDGVEDVLRFLALDATDTPASDVGAVGNEQRRDAIEDPM